MSINDSSKQNSLSNNITEKVDKKSSTQVRIDRGLHGILKLIAKKQHMSIKTLLEGYIADGLDKGKETDNEEV